MLTRHRASTSAPLAVTNQPTVDLIWLSSWFTTEGNKLSRRPSVAVRDVVDKLRQCPTHCCMKHDVGPQQFEDAASKHSLLQPCNFVQL